MAEELKKVKVKFLKHVMQYQPGDVAEVSSKEAEYLCARTIVDQCGVLVEVRKAMPLEEAEKLKSMKVDMSKLTQVELEEMGQKNLVATPRDEAFEKKLAKLSAVPAAKKEDKEKPESEDEDQAEEAKPAARKRG